MSQPSLFGSTDRGSVTANIDGGSRGNPGLAGFGVRLERSDGAVHELKGTLPHATNNIAEYHGLLAALRWAAREGVTTLHIRSDSQLLVRQLLGEYRVKNAGLRPLHEEARRLVSQIGGVTFEHIRRELNREADRLANEAMDEARLS